MRNDSRLGLGRRRRLLVCAALLVGLSPSALAAAADAAPVPLGSLGGDNGFAQAVNASGTVVGYSEVNAKGDLGPERDHAFLKSATGPLTDLGTLGGNNSYAAAINPDDQVVGDSTTDPNDDDHLTAFSWTPAGGMITLGTVEHLGETDAADVSSSGEVLVNADSADQDSIEAAFTWAAGTRVDLGNLGGDETVATDLNDDGQVVGSSTTTPDNDTSDAFLWSPSDGMQDLGTLGGTSSSASALNSSGEVVGTSTTATGDSHAFLWTAAGGMQDLGGPDGKAVAINDNGTVTGTYDDANGYSRAFVWTSSDGMTDIGDLGGESAGATAISSTGTVVGYSRTAGNQVHAFSWTPQTGMVDLGPSSDGNASAGAINSQGLAVGSSGPDRNQSLPYEWDTTDTSATPAAPGPPRSVTAEAGAASASVAWGPPESNGHESVSSYTVTASPGGAQTTVSGETGSALVGGLDNGTSYTFTVTATNSVGPGVASPASTEVTPQAGAVAPTTAAGTATPDSGANVFTGSDTSTSQPVITEVQVPTGTAGGPVSIAQGTVDKTPPAGYSFLGQQVNITAPAGTPDNPISLTFTVDSSLTGASTPATLQLFRTEGTGTPVLVPDCTDSGATPDPCISRRSAGGDDNLGIRLTVLTSSTSAWNFATKTQTPPPSHFTFKGFFSPVANPPKINKVRAGSAVPMPFSLNGYHGSAVIATGYPKSTAVSCSHPTQAYGAVTATNGTLKYAAKSKRYTYTWHTAKGYANTCRAIEVRLSDGTRHYALFHLAK